MLDEKKPIILLCWGYHREGWIEVFEALKDKFDFHYLYWISKQVEPASFTSCAIHYWGDFSSAQQIIKKIKPEKVVYMGTNSLLVLSLLFECKRKKIPTYTMQHGLFHDLKTNLYLDEHMAKNALNSNELAKNYKLPFSTMKFFLRSFRIEQAGSLIRIVKWLRDRKNMPLLAAWSKHKALYRQTDYYIVYTKYNGKYFTEIDGVHEHKMLPVGVPEFDKFFRYATKKNVVDNQSGTYNLLIDSALTYISEHDTMGVVSQQSYNDFILKLNSLSIKQNKKLYIKLHPYGYNNKSFIQDSNIEYFHNCDIVDLVMNSNYIFGFDSTLILPSLYFKKAILFALHEHSYFQNNMFEIKMAPMLNYFSFTLAELENALAFEHDDNSRSLLEERFLFKADSNSKCRIEKIFQQ